MRRTGTLLAAALAVALIGAPGAPASQRAKAPKSAAKTAKTSGAGTATQRPTTPPAVGPATPIKLPPVRERTLANGLEVIFVPGREQPVVSMSLMIKSGAASEPADRAGLAETVAGLLTKGTQTRTAQQIAEAIDAAGGDLGASADWDSTIASTTVLANRAPLAAELLADVVQRPTFAAEEVERARAQTLSGLQVSAASAGFVAQQVFDRIVFAGTPYAHPASGTPETIRAITRDDIVRFHREHYVPNNAVLAIVGDLSEADAFATAEKFFGGWARGTAPATPKTTFPSPGKLRIVVLDKPDAVQTEIRAGVAALPRADLNYYAAVVANAVFGGTPFSSRIEQELRVKRGLTYGASSQFDARLLGGAFLVETNTKTETTDEAVRVILDEMRRIGSGEVLLEELSARKNFIAGVYSLSLETPEALASRLLKGKLYGLPSTYVEDYTKLVNEVAPPDVRRIVSTYLRPEQLVIVLAGNASVFEEKIRALGPVEKIPFDAVDLGSDTLRRAAPTASAAGSEDAKAAEALVNRTIQALGGDAWVGQKSQVQKGSGELTVGGQTIALTVFEEYRVFPSKSRSNWGLDQGVIRRGYNGTVGWADQPGAGVIDVTAQFKQGESFGMGVLRRFRAGGVTARLAPDVEGAKGFALADADGRETTFYVDPATFLPVRVVYTSPQGERVTLLRDYKDVSGIKVPTTLEALVNGSRFLLATFAETEVNVDVDPALFEKPSS